MKTTLIAAILIAATASTAALAQPAARLSDRDFVKAARCKGLMKSDALGAADPAAIEALLKANKRGRADHIVEKANMATDAARVEAAKADESARAELIAERDGACQAFAG